MGGNLVLESMTSEEAEVTTVVEGSCETEGRRLSVFCHEGAKSDAMFISRAEYNLGGEGSA
jgi:hypothetical protein